MFHVEASWFLREHAETPVSCAGVRRVRGAARLGPPFPQQLRRREVDDAGRDCHRGASTRAALLDLHRRQGRKRADHDLALEGTGPGGLEKAGIKLNDVRPGDRIRVRCHLLKDGSSGCLLGFVTPMHGDAARGHGIERDWDGGGGAGLPATP